MYYIIFSFIAGCIAKLYDDIQDNILFNKIKKNALLLETLKIIHTITFMIVGFNNPLFYYLMGSGLIFSFMVDKNAYKYPYEKSLIINYLLFLFFINHSKFNFTVFYDLKFYFIIIESVLTLFFEALLIKEEYSKKKLFIRILFFITLIFNYFWYFYKYEDLILLNNYCLGYILISIIVQFYCLFINKKLKIKKYKNKKQQIKNKKIKNKKQQIKNNK